MIGQWLPLLFWVFKYPKRLSHVLQHILQTLTVDNCTLLRLLFLLSYMWTIRFSHLLTNLFTRSKSSLKVNIYGSTLRLYPNKETPILVSSEIWNTANTVNTYPKKCMMYSGHTIYYPYFQPKIVLSYDMAQYRQLTLSGQFI
jgi:hypothetical protein